MLQANTRKEKNTVVGRYKVNHATLINISLILFCIGCTNIGLPYSQEDIKEEVRKNIVEISEKVDSISSNDVKIISGECIKYYENIIPDKILVEESLYKDEWELFEEAKHTISHYGTRISIENFNYYVPQNYKFLNNKSMNGNVKYCKNNEIGKNINYFYPCSGSSQYSFAYQVTTDEGVILGDNYFSFLPTELKPINGTFQEILALTPNNDIFRTLLVQEFEILSYNITSCNYIKP